MAAALRTDDLRRAASLLLAARRVVVLTGAGVSAESGIPTFRSSHATMAGLWKDFDPATLATPDAFARDPDTVSRWYDWRRLGCLAALPNPGHLALARLERHVAAHHAPDAFTLLTQNVDRLHHKAGSARIIELHGNILVWRCTATHRRIEPPPQPFPAFPPPSPFRPGALLRPDVVWFGEMLPPHAIESALAALDACTTGDAFLSVGTSSVVHPAAGFIHHAARRGASTIEINPEPTPITPDVDLALHGPSGVILPRLLDLMGLHADPRPSASAPTEHTP